MSLRSGHGNGAGVPRIEVMPPDEQPDPVPAKPAPLAFRQDGTIADSTTARELGRRGGLERARRQREATALLAGTGLATLAEDSDFRPYRSAADDFVRQHVAAVAMQAGGVCGAGPSSIIASAGVQLAASRFFSDRAAATCDPALFSLASSLANASRQNLLAAYELAVREAQARTKAQASSPRHAAWLVSDDEETSR